jgi:hypothetical protein
LRTCARSESICALRPTLAAHRSNALSSSTDVVGVCTGAIGAGGDAVVGSTSDVGMVDVAISLVVACVDEDMVSAAAAAVASATDLAIVGAGFAISTRFAVTAGVGANVVVVAIALVVTVALLALLCGTTGCR